MGVKFAIFNTKEELKAEAESLNEFALKNDLFYIGSNLGVTFNFYRKAKNEDFESWGEKKYNNVISPFYLKGGNGYIDEPNAPQIINPINLP